MFTALIIGSVFVATVLGQAPQVESAESAFARMDADKNGLIDVNDYFHRDPWYTEYTKKTFTEMDVNGDGKVSITEYKAYHTMIEEAMKKESEKAAFVWANSTISIYDLDKDDMLNVTELAKFTKAAFNQETDNYEELIKPFDKDNNKKLDLAELTQFLANIPYDKMKPCAGGQVAPATIPGIPVIKNN